MKLYSLLLVILLGCIPQSNKSIDKFNFTIDHPKAKVILITIDGTRWQDVFEGSDPSLSSESSIPSTELLPNLYQNASTGMIVGKDSLILASGPMHISLPGYLEIMRGHPSWDCQSNYCNPTLHGTIPDLFSNSAIFSSWETIRKTVPSKFVVNCGRYYRSNSWENLKLKDNTDFPEMFGMEYRPDFFTEQAALQYLQNNKPEFLWIALGDTDEWGHAGSYKRYLLALKSADKFIGSLVARFGDEYTFIITADHGRSNNWQNHGEDQESSRVWLMMFGNNIPNKGFVSYPENKYLSNIYPTIKHLTKGNKINNSLM